MHRRAFMSGMATMLAAPLTVGAQQAVQAPRIGFLWGGTPATSLILEFEDTLRERGWVSGQNITIEHRAAEGRNERLSHLAVELVQAGMNVLLTSQSPSTQAAKKASRTILIVMLGNGDPFVSFPVK